MVSQERPPGHQLIHDPCTARRCPVHRWGTTKPHLTAGHAQGRQPCEAGQVTDASISEASCCVCAAQVQAGHPRCTGCHQTDGFICEPILPIQVQHLHTYSRACGLACALCNRCLMQHSFISTTQHLHTGLLLQLINLPGQGIARHTATATYAA